MTNLKSLALVVAVAVMTIVPVAAQENPPAGAFKAVHLVSFTPQQVALILAWMTDMNAVLEKAGHKDIRYRLYKVIGKQAGKYDFMWESSWPSGEVYTKVHSEPEWKAVADKHPGVNALMKDEIYNRYVEVLPEKR
jgi:hypothetical protein